MRLQYVTFTGVDEATDLADLADLARAHPISEWGFLYSPKRRGLPGRYPSLSFLHGAFAKLPSDVRVALHVGGDGVTDLMVNEHAVTDLAELIEKRQGRVQLNFNLAKRHLDVESLGRFIEGRPALNFITQHHSGNRQVLPALRGLPNHAVLFDASGGTGTAPERWPKALPDVLCGYAGGLGPDTVRQALPLIAVACGPRETWIDMEGRLRITTPDGSDRLDLGRCEAVLGHVGQFLGEASHQPLTPESASHQA